MDFNLYLNDDISFDLSIYNSVLLDDLIITNMLSSIDYRFMNDLEYRLIESFETWNMNEVFYISNNEYAEIQPDIILDNNIFSSYKTLADLDKYIIQDIYYFTLLEICKFTDSFIGFDLFIDGYNDYIRERILEDLDLFSLSMIYPLTLLELSYIINNHLIKKYDLYI